MSTTTLAYLLAAVIVLLIIAVAVIYRRRENREKFMPDDPTTPKLRQAVKFVGGDLDCIANTARAVKVKEEEIESSAGSPYPEAVQVLEGAQAGISEIVNSVERLRGAIRTMTPTYQNALGLYRGLRDSDRALWAAAKSLDAAGKQIDQIISDTGMSDDPGPDHALLVMAAGQLRQISTCLYSLVRSVHYLGGALQLE